MGFLEVGTPLEWQDTEEYHAVLDYVIEHGVTEFLNVYNKVKDRKRDVLLWGDELEFHVFQRQPDGTVKIWLRAFELLHKLEAEDEESKTKLNEAPLATWHPEYGAWMIEATPYGPYGGYAHDLLQVEHSLRYRRQRIYKALSPSEGLSSLTTWPLMGVGQFWCGSDKALTVNGPVSRSYFLPDEIINPHPRFATLTRNIRKRRGNKVDIRLPLFKDKETRGQGSASAAQFKVATPDNLGDEQVGEVYMDAMGFGMGCCCLQVTFQARDVDESRILYDQLQMLCPIFLALTAAAPIFKGLLVDTDVRWQVIAASVDCRTPVNLGVSETPMTLPGAQVPQRGTVPISKSRYESISCFISQSPSLRNEYNDGKCEVNSAVLERLLASGIDEMLARHIAHLFIRDPLVVFSERIHQVNDNTSTEHFENIQSTNWNTMRWKPPGLDVKTGWRVEFRPMEKQLTDFEDAAFITVIVLLTRVILFFDLNLYVPITKVDENMRRAHHRDAVLKQKFFFRKTLFLLEKQCVDVDSDEAARAEAAPPAHPGNVEDEYEEMKVEEILLGKGDDFPGLFALIHAYLDIMQADAKTVSTVNKYLDFIADRAKGNLPTEAKFFRDFVKSHPDYKHDSVVSEKIASDLVLHAEKISNGVIQESRLLGSNLVVPLDIAGGNGEEARRGRSEKADSLSKRLRGASFHEEISSDHRFLYRCSLVRSLVDKYKSAASSKHNLSNKGFANTPAYLDTTKAIVE